MLKCSKKSDYYSIKKIIGYTEIFSTEADYLTVAKIPYLDSLCSVGELLSSNVKN